MSQRIFLVSVIAVAATALPSFAAAAVIDPLLVVVETAPGAAVDAIEVRQAIAGELGRAVRAPRDGAARDTPDLLIVAVDRAEIRMSLRAGAGGVVSRAVPAPSDRKARLQSIGWLAGNLARDQVGVIVAPVPAPAPVTVASIDVEPSSPATDPPPFPDNAAREAAGASGGVVSTQAAPAATGGAGSMWSLTLGGGPSSAVLLGSGERNLSLWPGPGVWYLEFQRRPSSDGLIVGAALDVGPEMESGMGGPSSYFIGGAALVGGGRHFGRFFIEGTAGLGLETYQSMGAGVSTITNSETGVTTEIQSGTSFVLGLYLRGQATAGVALSKSFDLLASVGGHLGNLGQSDTFLTSSLGVRLRFQ